MHQKAAFMDVSSVNLQRRLACFPTSTTLDTSVLSLLGKISVNVKGDRAHLSSAHFSQTVVLARAYFGGMTTGAPQREHGSVLGSVMGGELVRSGLCRWGS